VPGWDLAFPPPPDEHAPTASVVTTKHKKSRLRVTRRPSYLRRLTDKQTAERRR
jgi:hypothetical protein